MSEIILPPGVYAVPGGLKTAEPARDQEFEEAPDEQKGKQLPVPKGYKILCAVPRADERFEGSDIIKSRGLQKQEEWGTTILAVLGLGDLAYKDADKFPTGPWCKEGDFVLTRTYSGTRFMIAGQEFRLLNDDQVEAVVDDPRGVMRAAA